MQEPLALLSFGLVVWTPPHETACFEGFSKNVQLINPTVGCSCSELFKAFCTISTSLSDVGQAMGPVLKMAWQLQKEKWQLGDPKTPDFQ